VQRLFFLNSPFVERQSKALAERFTGSDEDRIRAMYRAVFARLPDETELALGLEFLKSGGWPAYAQVLLGSNEFLFID
jgi:hypothetical protein